MSAPILGRGQFAVAEWWQAGVHIGIVTSVEDPDHKGRVQVKLAAIDPTGEAKIWARVAVPYAGNNFGAFLIPGVDAEVLVAFVAGDAASPIVIGALWNGATGLPERLPGNAVDRWTLTGKNGTRIAIVEEQQGQEKVEIQLPSNQVSATLSDASGGEILIKVAGNSIKLSSSGISIKTSGTFEVQSGGSATVTAPSLSVSTPNATFSQTVTCIDVKATSVVSANYSRGIGNIW